MQKILFWEYCYQLLARITNTRSGLEQLSLVFANTSCDAVKTFTKQAVRSHLKWRILYANSKVSQTTWAGCKKQDTQHWLRKRGSISLLPTHFSKSLTLRLGFLQHWDMQQSVKTSGAGSRYSDITSTQVSRELSEMLFFQLAYNSTVYTIVWVLYQLILTVERSRIRILCIW